MRTVTLLVFILAAAGHEGCGSETPMLGGVPHPSNGAMAGGAAAAAAAMTLADPHASDRKPEQRQEAEKRPVDVKEQVPPSAFDHLDGSGSGTGSGHEVARPHAGSGSGSAAPATAATAKKLPTLPTPHDAVDPDHADSH
jgi:hypothetical protein